MAIVREKFPVSRCTESLSASSLVELPPLPWRLAGPSARLRWSRGVGEERLNRGRVREIEEHDPERPPGQGTVRERAAGYKEGPSWSDGMLRRRGLALQSLRPDAQLRRPISLVQNCTTLPGLTHD